MPGRTPGPQCGTQTQSIDPGTQCRARTPPPGPLAGARKDKPSTARFGEVWDNYPSDAPYVDREGNVPKGYENQCAIKVSAALLGAGVNLGRFSGATVSIGGRRHAIRAQELGRWLKTAGPGLLQSSAETITGTDWQSRIKGRTGIVYFENYWLRPGEKSPSGDHIDLWNGSRMTASGFSGALVSALRFGLGVESGPGFSDLGKSTTILFWELK